MNLWSWGTAEPPDQGETGEGGSSSLLFTVSPTVGEGADLVPGPLSELRSLSQESRLAWGGPGPQTSAPGR